MIIEIESKAGRMTKARSQLSLLLLLAFLVVAGEAAGASIRGVNTADKLTIESSVYRLTVSHLGFAVEISRAGETIFQSTTQSDAEPNLGFVVNGEPQHLTKLRSCQESKGTYSLEYDTTTGGVTARVEIRPAEDRIRFHVWLLASDVTYSPTLRYRLSPGAWYGGGFQGYRDVQSLPLNQATIASRMFLAQGASQGTPLWYSSRGVAVWVRTPHDFAYSIRKASEADETRIVSVEMPGVSMLAYDILVAPTVRDVLRTINHEIGFVQAVPPEAYFELPIYTTWVEFKTAVTQQKVVEFARTIREHNLPAGVIEIDDKWEEGYGDMRFDAAKFPDPKGMNDELHRLGFRVTLWIHPFVNIGTRSFDDPAMRKLLMKDLSGEPGIIHWWQGDGAVWDFTNPAAAAEFRRRLGSLQSGYGFDGFKFDGGDASLVPVDFVPYAPITAAQFPDIYNREAAAYFPWSEARVGVYSQPTGVVQRLIDKNSTWGSVNGLASVVPEAILTSMRGFVFVMPDMVGGNQYDNDRIDKELLVRWAQASALMPMMQFSLGPWHFDEETVRLCREASDLHLQFAPKIAELAAMVPKTGEALLRPVWYNSPTDLDAEKITDEFMLGDSVLVAPVIQAGARARDIYLPSGQWRDFKTKEIITGGRMIRNYPAPLDTLPLFVQAGTDTSATVILKKQNKLYTNVDTPRQ
jgi:alpha-glucosidase (family GH31 glycosyl hydrolase)